jgi:hypothetical protein
LSRGKLIDLNDLPLEIQLDLLDRDGMPDAWLAHLNLEAEQTRYRSDAATLWLKPA